MGLKSTHTEPYVLYQPYFNTNGKEYYIFFDVCWQLISEKWQPKGNHEFNQHCIRVS